MDWDIHPEYMLLILGEILIDELPDGYRPGGAPFNVAQHLTRLGLEAALLSRVGCDGAGDELVRTMERLDMDTRLIQHDRNYPTGRVEVSLSEEGIPSYRIRENVAYDHIDFQSVQTGLSSCPLVYFGSLVQRTDTSRRNLHDFLSALPEQVLRLYDMNLRPGCDHAEVVLSSLEKTDILKINDEELDQAGRLIGSELKGDELVRLLMETFDIGTVALTRGAQGSSLYNASGLYEAPAAPLNPGALIDTVGAGDSFTAVLAWGILKGLSPKELLRRANLLAGRICTLHGAVPDNNEIYQDIK